MTKEVPVARLSAYAVVGLGICLLAFLLFVGPSTGLVRVANAQTVTTITTLTTVTVPASTSTNTITFSQSATTGTTTITGTFGGSTYTYSYTSYTGTTATVVTSIIASPPSTYTITSTYTSQALTGTATYTYTYGAQTITATVYRASTVAGSTGQTPPPTTPGTTSTLNSSSSAGGASTAGGGISFTWEIGLVGIALAAVVGVYAYTKVYGGRKQVPPESTPTTVSPGSEPVSVKPPPEVPRITPVPMSYGKTEKGGCTTTAEWKFHALEMNLHPKVPLRTASLKVVGTGYDQPFPIRAFVEDFHTLVHECRCPGVSGDISRRSHRMMAIHRVGWEVVQGKGGFIGKTGDQLRFIDGGDEVIFRPPTLNVGESDTSRIRVTAYHDDNTKQPYDHFVRSFITLGVKRIPGVDPQDIRYEYTYSIEAGPNQYGSNDPPDANGVCNPVSEWQDSVALDGSAAIPPKCNPGDYLRIYATGSDTDTLKLSCVPTGSGPCTFSTSVAPEMSDPLFYTWNCSDGEFPAAEPRPEKKDFGKAVVWHAPQMPGVVKITLELRDSGREFPDAVKTIGTEIMVGEPVVSEPGLDLNLLAKKECAKEFKALDVAVSRYNRACDRVERQVRLISWRYIDSLHLQDRPVPDVRYNQYYKERDDLISQLSPMWDEVISARDSLANCQGVSPDSIKLPADPTKASQWW